MTIKEIEQMTGLTRSVIRYYEKEKLIDPIRNASNGYRDYSEEDVENIRKIAYLRTLGISVEDIRRLINHEADLYRIVKKQKQMLEQQMSDLENAKSMCERMLASSEKVDYEHLDIGKYVADPQDYWSQNRDIFRFDSVSFFYLWGGTLTWGVLTAACFLLAIGSVGTLPAQIPVQWSGGTASSFADRIFIFAFPVVCVMIRIFLHPFVWRWLNRGMIVTEAIADYIVNYFCMIALSIEVFIVLYVNGIMKHVTTILLFDTVVLMALLFMAVRKKGLLL